MRPGAWSPEEVDDLRRRAESGQATQSIADALGRSLPSVMSKLAKLRFSVANLDRAFRDRIVSLTQDGVPVSRITRTMGMTSTAVLRVLAIEGVQPASERLVRPDARLPIIPVSTDPVAEGVL